MQLRQSSGVAADEKKEEKRRRKRGRKLSGGWLADTGVERENERK